MNSLSYKKIEEILDKRPRGEVKVPVSDLRDMFKTVKHALRCHGILGFTDEGTPIVNDLGMAEIVRNVATIEFESLGTMTSCHVSRKTGELIWNAEMAFAAPNGTTLTMTQGYPLSILEENQVFKFELP